MLKENLKENTSQEDENLCKKCHEEPIFMNGFCVYCYEEEVYGNGELEDRKKSSNMIVHGQGMKDPHQQELSSRRTAEKISRIKKKK